jgi:UDP-N-acetylmuramate: L-alanyl-gamma-D-glutamyl-meso-diaminopimelate ligase
LIGGLPKNFPESFRVPGPRRLPTDSTPSKRRTPFVVEGDEYDTAFFEKTPKFWHYRPEVGIVTSIEHDHVDIYPDAELRPRPSAASSVASESFWWRAPTTPT